MVAPDNASDLNLSVVIPTHNRANLLPDAIESALGQTLSPVEVIVIDDGSTDDTEAAIVPYLPRIRYIRQENQGVSSARNRGVSEATGEWIGFLDSDDVWEPTRLEWIQATLHHLPQAEWLITDALLVRSDLEPKSGPQGFSGGFQVFGDVGMSPVAFFGGHLRKESLRQTGKECALFVGDAFPLLLQGNFVQPSALAVRKDVFESVDGFDPNRRLAEDTDLALRLAATHTLAILPLPLVRWRAGDYDSLISRKTSRP
jgi:glycosyltransferase involved in cell wall biosynthesis